MADKFGKLPLVFGILTDKIGNMPNSETSAATRPGADSVGSLSSDEPREHSVMPIGKTPDEKDAAGATVPGDRPSQDNSPSPSPSPAPDDRPLLRRPLDPRDPRAVALAEMDRLIAALPLMRHVETRLAVIGGIMIVFGWNKDRPIKFGPFLAIAGWIALMWGDAIIAAYLELTTPDV